MTKNLDKEGLNSIVDNYQLFYIDLWGVVHNGLELHSEAINTLKQITKILEKTGQEVMGIILLIDFLLLKISICQIYLNSKWFGRLRIKRQKMIFKQIR